MDRRILLLFLSIYMIQSTRGQVEPTAVLNNTSGYAVTRDCLWSTCNVTGYPSQILNYSLDCCTLQVPLDYARPNRSISISMSRLTPLQLTTENNTLFFLMGGPGGSGWILLETTARNIPASFGLTLIFPDHRGTGLSTVLGCDDNDSQTINVDCVNYLKARWGIDGLNQFSITAAAHDLAVQVQSFQLTRPGRISIYGVSYGTLWLDRFLQIYPTLVQSAVMDGVINPALISISRYDLWASSVASQFLTHCQTEPDCSRYFPADLPPPIMLARILSDLDSNQQRCLQEHFSQYQFTSDWLRVSFFYLMQSGDQYFYRTVLPAVIFRLYRCNAEDVRVLSFFFQRISGAMAGADQRQNSPALLFSNVLNCNIVQSELWLAAHESEVDNETIAVWHRSTIMSAGNGQHLVAIRSQWPRYPRDQYHDQVASYSPLLMISGELDPATIFSQVALLASTTSKTRTFYGIPLAGHGTINLALVGYTCPLHLICSWAFPDLFPVEWSDPKCIRDMPTSIDFVGATESGQRNSLFVLNISRPFGNDTSGPMVNSAERCVQVNPVWTLMCLSVFGHLLAMPEFSSL